MSYLALADELHVDQAVHHDLCLTSFCFSAACVFTVLGAEDVLVLVGVLNAAQKPFLNLISFVMET